MEHPDVDIAVVIGIPHEDMGSVPHAIVRCRAGVRDLDETLLLEFVAQRLARSNTPKSYEYTMEDLRDDARYVSRGELRQLLMHSPRPASVRACVTCGTPPPATAPTGYR